MIQAATFYVKAKVGSLDDDALKNIYVGLAAAVLILMGYFWYEHLDAKHHRRPTVAARQAAPADVAPAPAPDPAPAPYTPPPAPSQPEVAVAAPAASSSSNSAAGGLGDSLMSVLSPSAKAETMQSGFPTMRTTGGSAVPSGRTQLQTPARPEAPLTDEQKLLKAAQDKFDKVIDMASKNPDIFGFAPDDKFDEVKLGDPIRVYTVAPADRDNYQDGQPIKAILQPANQWLFPVILNDEVRVMIPVRRVGKQYAADNCSRSLAMVYEKIEERWPASDGYHPQLVANPNLTGYYFTIPELADQNLTDTGEMFQYNPTLSPASVILASWH